MKYNPSTRELTYRGYKFGVRTSSNVTEDQYSRIKGILNDRRQRYIDAMLKNVATVLATCLLYPIVLAIDSAMSIVEGGGIAGSIPVWVFFLVPMIAVVFAIISGFVHALSYATAQEESADLVLGSH